MSTLPSPSNELSRLHSLRRHRILDTAPETSFNDLARLASELCQTPIALISFVDAQRQWFKAAIGFAMTEGRRSDAFCSYAIEQDDLLIVGDAKEDARFARSKFVVTDPFIRFYAGAPLIAEDGERLGALCVLDHVPRVLTDLQRSALRTLGRQVELQLRFRLQGLELARIREERDALQAVVLSQLGEWTDDASDERASETRPSFA